MRRSRGRTAGRVETSRSRREGVRAHSGARRRLSRKTISAPHQTMKTYLEYPLSLHHRQTNPQDQRTSPRALSSRGSGTEYLRAMKSDLPAAMRTRRECPMVTRTLGTDLRVRRTRQNVSANARKEGVQKTHLREVETTKAIRAAKRTRRECRGASRTSGSGRGSCGTRQNASGNTRREKVEETHLGGLQANQTTRAAKRSYQAVSRVFKKALGRSETSAPMERTHHVDIQTKEGAWTCRRSREASRSIGTAVRFLRAPNTMGNDPGARRTSVTSKRTRYVELEGLEAMWMRKSNRGTSRANGSATAMAMESRWTGYGAGRMAQRAAHGATRNESDRDRWLESRRVSTNSANTRWRTHLSHPDHLPSTTDDP